MPSTLGRTKECNMHHLPPYNIRCPGFLYDLGAPNIFYFPYGKNGMVKRVRHHIDYASHLLGRNATQEEGQALAEYVEQAVVFKPASMLFGMFFGPSVRRGVAQSICNLRTFGRAQRYAQINAVGYNEPLRAVARTTFLTRLRYATLGWALGDLISFWAVKTRERRDPRLMSLRSCDPKDTMWMAWDATSLWKGKLATGPDNTGFCHWKRYVGRYIFGNKSS